MSFFSIFLALVIEQARPMSPEHFLHQWLRKWADWISSHVDGGTRSQAWLAWGLMIGAPAGLAILIHWLLAFSSDGFLPSSGTSHCFMSPWDSDNSVTISLAFVMR